ncbi:MULTISPECIES: hypothetical protein [Kitasatospora]|uniref:C2H2-type domain-containing protein n=1 Tax=Kitasatospora cathayae TaxID=3004092 RepID=A0ABY7Q6G1_9ACTN|nr:hypothetical protein [Kitasatospora sp. HUAS 3-15]WBP87729.1 hypothetical protein O1G21_19015 [Kitasatospora sp. HUAS 3-15]
MMHQMRAEYGAGGEAGGVRLWHMVRGTQSVAMCGRELDPGAPVRETVDWGKTPELCCHTCGAYFLRETPYLSAEHQ